MFETVYDGMDLSDMTKFPVQSATFRVDILQKPKIEVFPMSATLVKVLINLVSMLLLLLLLLVVIFFLTKLLLSRQSFVQCTLNPTPSRRRLVVVDVKLFFSKLF